MPYKHPIAYKFALEATVWTMDDNLAIEAKVNRLEIIVWKDRETGNALEDISYLISPVSISKHVLTRPERKLFATKQELLSSL